MNNNLLIAFAISFPASFLIAVGHIVTVNRTPQPPPDLRIGIILSLGGVLGLVDTMLFWSTFGVGSLLIGIQGAAALGSGAFKLLRHFRRAEFQTR